MAVPVSVSQYGRLSSPFSREHAIKIDRAADKTAPRNSVLLERPDQSPSVPLDELLDTPRLGRIHAFLWLAGLPRPARPLHRQRLLLRDIVVTERADVVERRYRYGELRLSRLNALYRLGFAGRPYARNAVFGSMSRPTRYKAFFERIFSCIIVCFVYITVILSAMQVALSPERLTGNAEFQEFSYYICIISLSFVLLALVLLAAVWAVLFGYHLSSTRRYHKKAEHSWRKLTI